MMDRPHILLLLMSSALMALAGLWETRLAASEPVPPLVRQLGDTDFQRRVDAERLLLQQGAAGLDMIEAGTRSNDPEIRQRSLRLLGLLRRNAFREQRDRIRRDPWTVSAELAPAWEIYQSFVGDSEEARDLYVKMIEEESELMLAVALRPDRWIQDFERRCADLRTFVERRPNRELPPLSVLALLFLANHPDNKLNPFSAQTIASLMVDSNFYSFIQSCSDGEGRVCRALLSEWVIRPGHTTAPNRLELATRYQLSAGTVPALEIIGNRHAVGASRTQLQNAIRFLTTHGTAATLQDLEPLLNLERVTLKPVERGQFLAEPPPRQPGGNNQDQQLSDLALLGLLRLTQQDPQRYGFTNIRLDADQRFTANVPNFTTEEDRRQALIRWYSWRMAHPLYFSPGAIDAGEGVSL